MGHSAHYNKNLNEKIVRKYGDRLPNREAVLKHTQPFSTTFRQKLAGATVYYFMFHLPGNLNNLLAFISQRSIKGSKYIQKDLGVSWGSDDFDYTYYVIVPSLVFWACFIAYFLWVLLYRGNAKYLDPKSNRERRVREQREY